MNEEEISATPVDEATEQNGIEVDKETVEDFFKNNTVYLPRYQREYSWEKRNIETLVEDIKNNEKYYIGNLMYSKKDGLIELIDGQQRLITLYLILSALYHLKKRNKKIIDSFDEGLLFSDEEHSKTRFILDDRTADQNTKVFNYICKENTPSAEIQKTNEYKQYKSIKRYIGKLEINVIKTLYKNTLSCQFVFINTTNSKIKSDKVFLNLNTKGVKLSDESIVKSLLFTNIDDEKDFDSMRNSWFEVFHPMSDTEKDNYLTDFISIFETEKKSKIRKPEIIPTFEGIVSKGKSKETYELLAKPDSVYLAAHNAIVKGDAVKYIQLFNDSSFKMETFFHYVKYLRKFNFIQFDIALKSMLFYKDDRDKKKIKDNYDLLISYIKVIYMYYVMQGLKNTSPSTYGNEFVRFAVEMRNKDNLKDNIKNSISIFKIKKMKKEDLQFLDEIKVKQNSKELKYITSLISFLDEDLVCDYTGEHFIAASSGKNEALSFENIIPVSLDVFKDKDENAKITMYLEKISIEKHIKIFLTKDYYSNFSKKTLRANYSEYRKDRYKKLFVKFFNDALDKILK